jgi:CCR4-NOT transcriptional regulation complex NOT5 subunit
MTDNLEQSVESSSSSEQSQSNPKEDGKKVTVKVMTVACPNLFRYNGGATEALLKLKNTEPVEIICTHYNNKNKKCRNSGSKEDCLYAQGWRSLK